ncbi:hypothetical protein R3P38DRAFT_3410811 [Favolaschia claudopus]|uniref:BTB domain-containing protein n=1 Tax=Favolaschia claudopus TaxID=2862362 RepID=A0AAV9ZHJ2_9AGAR
MATTEGSSSSTQNLIRVEDLWFPDHNLVLQAGNRLFRVSGGLLAARSPVFRDMLSIPQPESQHTIDGCPVVVLHDSPVDAEYFVRAIFDSGFFERPPSPTSFPIVAGVLRLSTKYDVEYLQHRALLHLSVSLPRNLDEFDSMPAHPFNLPNCEYALLKLVNELGVTWALPMCMYFAACFPVEAILDGIAFDENSSSSSSDSSSSSSSGSHSHSPPTTPSSTSTTPKQPTSHLPPPLRRTLLIARSSLSLSQTHTILRSLRVLPADRCVTPAQCTLKARHAHDAFTGIKTVNPLGVMVPSIWRTIEPLLCAECYPVSRKEYVQARGRVWEELPAVFGLGGWESLRRETGAEV